MALLTRQPDTSVSVAVYAPAASFDNAACRRTHGNPSLKKQPVGDDKHGTPLCCGAWQGGKPLPAGRVSIRDIWAALKTALLSIVLVIAARRVIYGWFVLAGCLIPSLAVTAGEQAPEKMLEQAAEQMLSALREQDAQLRGNPRKLHALVEEVLVPHVDLEALSRAVLGKYWRSATAGQRSRFAQEFKGMLIRFYASALLEYADFRFRFFAPKMDKGARRITVRSEVMRRGGAPHAVNYRLIRRDDQWKVYDITIDGVSAVATYRSSFSEEIRRDGLEHLLKKMADWNRRDISPPGNRP